MTTRHVHSPFAMFMAMRGLVMRMTSVGVVVASGP